MRDELKGKKREEKAQKSRDADTSKTFNFPLLTFHFRYALLLLVVVFLIGAGLFSFDVSPTARAQVEPTALPLFALPDPRLVTRSFSNSTIVLTDNDRQAITVNTLNNTVSFVNVQEGGVQNEIPVGIDPRNIAVTLDGSRAVVTNRADGTLSVLGIREQAVLATIPVGVLPYGIVIPDNNTAFVSLQSGAIAIVDLGAGQVSELLPVPDLPTGLALWGDFLYVTHFWTGDISLIYLPQRQVISTVSTGIDTGFSQAIELDISRGIAYLPQTRSNAQDSSLTYDTTVFPVVNVMNLGALTTGRVERITLDTADRPVNVPFAIALDRFQQRLYVLNAGSDNVSVIDLTTGVAITHIEVGANPRGAILNRDGTTLYVHNMIDGSISAIDTRTLSVADELPISTLTISAELQLGAQNFHSAEQPMSEDGWISCANCHFDGLSDGRNWLDFGDGGRNTPVLFHLLETPPYSWSGAWDELADVEIKIRDLQAGLGLIEGDTSLSPADPHGGMSIELDSLVTYLESLTGPVSPFTENIALIERGAEVFEAQGCMTCHAGDAGTDLQVHDVGTGGEYDTPTVRWLWLSAPYFHDGGATTLRDVFTLPGAHQIIYDVPVEDVEALIAYLLSLPQG